MVAFSGSEPIGVLIGAKRPSGTLVQKIAVHPEHRRQGHARHLLTSLGSKLAILGPPRMVAEIPRTLASACELFSTSGYVAEETLTDYVLRSHQEDHGDEMRAGFVIPVTVDDLAANGLLADADRQVCWERSVETLFARRAEIHGLAVASEERIEAYLLYATNGTAAPTEILSLRSLVDDDGIRLGRLIFHLRARGGETLRFPKVYPDEIPNGWLERVGFSPACAHVRYAANARNA